jgi:hypothetical protein
MAGSKGPRPAQKAKCIKTLAVTSRIDHAQSASGRRRLAPPVRGSGTHSLNFQKTIRERFRRVACVTVQDTTASGGISGR